MVQVLPLPGFELRFPCKHKYIKYRYVLIRYKLPRFGAVLWKQNDFVRIRIRLFSIISDSDPVPTWGKVPDPDLTSHFFQLLSKQCCGSIYFGSGSDLGQVSNLDQLMLKVSGPTGSGFTSLVRLPLGEEGTKLLRVRILFRHLCRT